MVQASVTQRRAKMLLPRLRAFGESQVCALFIRCQIRGAVPHAAALLMDDVWRKTKGTQATFDCNKSSTRTGKSRTRTPVAWYTAAVMAAATPASPISPMPRAPISLRCVSG